MLLANLSHRESQTGATWSLTSKSLPYSWLLTRLVNWRRDIHLVQGDVNASPDVESVAGTVVKFCESYSNSHYLALADEDGILYLFNTLARGQQALTAKWSVHKNAIFDLEWLPFMPRIITASGHQIACLIDINTKQTIGTFKGHVSSLKTITCRRTDPYVFATGGRDGCICIWDQRVSRRGNTIPTSNEIKQAHASGSRHTRKSTSQSITGLCFQDETTLISCASNDGSIKVWDLRRSYKTHKSEPIAKHKFSYHGKSLKQVGYSGLIMDHSRSFIFANCIDDCVYQFSGISYQDQAVAAYKGHRNKTFFVKSALSPDDKYLITGSSDNHARIYEVVGQKSRPSPISYELRGHKEEVTSVTWSRYDVGKIATISDDDSLRIWKFGEIHNDDVIEGTAHQIQAQESPHSNLTWIRSKSSSLSGASYNNNKIHNKIHDNMLLCNNTTPQHRTHELQLQLNTLSPDKDVLPWPVLNGLHIQPRLSSPKKLLISPRKSASGASPYAFNTPGVSPSSTGSSYPVNQAKRKLIDSDFCLTSPSKRARGIISTSPTRQLSPSLTYSATLSPIRINNSSKIIVNITPTTSAAGHASAARDCSTQFSSPTANLPNSVMDPHTPKRQDKENTSASGSRRNSASDWLSQLSKEKQKKRANSPSVTLSANTPSRSGQKASRNSSSASKTPTSGRKVAQTLMKYFSPTSAAAAASGSPITKLPKTPTANISNT